MTNKIIIAMLVVILALLAYVFYLRERVANLNSEIAISEISQKTLQEALEQEKKTSIALLNQIEGLYRIQEERKQEQDRNKDIISRIKSTTINKDEVANEEIINEVADIISAPLPTYGVRN